MPEQEAIIYIDHGYTRGWPREEVFKSGDVYYIEPGHGTVVEAGTEIVEFSPKELLRRTMEVISRNMELAATT